MFWERWYCQVDGGGGREDGFIFRHSIRNYSMGSYRVQHEASVLYDFKAGPSTVTPAAAERAARIDGPAPLLSRVLCYAGSILRKELI